MPFVPQKSSKGTILNFQSYCCIQKISMYKYDMHVVHIYRAIELKQIVFNFSRKNDTQTNNIVYSVQIMFCRQHKKSSFVVFPPILFLSNSVSICILSTFSNNKNIFKKHRFNATILNSKLLCNCYIKITLSEDLPLYLMSHKNY